MFKNRKKLVSISFLKNSQNSHENTWDLETWFLLAKNRRMKKSGSRRLGCSLSLSLCLCVCMCVCVCVYTLPPVGFFRLQDICDIREKLGSTIFCCEYYLGASAKFLHLYLWIYLISPPKMKTPAVLLLERKRYDITCSAKRWYILI